MVLLATTVLTLGSAAPVEAEDLSSYGEDVRLAGPASEGRALAVFTRTVVRDDGSTSLDVLARRVGRDGRPLGEELLVGQDAAPGPGVVGDAATAAYDSRRRRWLVAWSGHEPGMAQVPCPPPHPPEYACRRAKREIQVRVVDASGRLGGAARQVTETGAPDDVGAIGAVPALAYDRRTDRFLLVAAAFRENLGMLVDRVLTADGVPAGASRQLALTAAPNTPVPEARLAALPQGGFLLAFTSGDMELHTRPLGASGRPRGRTRTISKPGRPGAFSPALAVDATTGEALVVWFEARSGAKGGVRARRLAADGRSAGRTRELPFPVGVGAVSVTPFGRGWLYGFTEERAMPVLGRAALVHRAGRSGALTGSPGVVSEDDAAGPAVVDAGGGRALVGWTYRPVSRGPLPMQIPPRPRAQLVRP